MAWCRASGSLVIKDKWRRSFENDYNIKSTRASANEHYGYERDVGVSLRLGSGLLHSPFSLYPQSLGAGNPLKSRTDLLLHSPFSATCALVLKPWRLWCGCSPSASHVFQ